MKALMVGLGLLWYQPSKGERRGHLVTAKWKTRLLWLTVIVSLTRGDGGLMISCQGWKSRLSPWPSLTLPSLLVFGDLITALQMWRSDSPLGLCWHCRTTAFPAVFAWSTKIIVSLSWTLSWSFGEREQASVWTFAGQCLSKFLGCRSLPLRIPRPQASLPSSLLMFILYIMSRNFSLL